MAENPTHNDYQTSIIKPEARKQSLAENEIE